MRGLVVRAGPERVAIPAAAILEVVPLVELVPASGAPAAVAGLARYRGTVVPVIDLARLTTGQPCPHQLSTRLVILEVQTDAGARRLALLTDRTEDLLDIALPAPGESYRPPVPAGEFDLGPLANDAVGVVRLLDMTGLGDLAFKLPLRLAPAPSESP